MRPEPLCIDLFCGLGGWADGFLAEGYEVVGFDNHRHEYWMPEVVAGDDGHKNTKPVEKRGWTQGCAISLGMEDPTAKARLKLVRYPGQLVIQDVLTLHGSQFRNATVIVASPPCQNYSYLAMPWSRSSNPENSRAAKALRHKWETEGPDNRLFDACFRIQREACEAAGRYIPLIVENVRGARPWVGRSAWNYGSFHLWGDVPALMPMSLGFRKRNGRNFHTHALTAGAVSSPSFHGAEHETRGVGMGSNNTGVKDNPDGTNRPSGSWFRIADSSQGDRGPVGQKVPVYSDPRRNGGKGVHLTSPRENDEGLKIGGDWFRDPACHSAHGSRSNARKAASAQIAKIPLPLAEHIARVYYPRKSE